MKIALALALALALSLFASAVLADPMVFISAGDYRPLYASEEFPLESVADFSLDVFPVTHQQFFSFVRQQPQWQKNKVAPLFAEPQYLQQWQLQQGQWQPAAADLDRPVTHVSWFAARAYCQNQQQRLPTIAEWEYAARASETSANGSDDVALQRKILDWYGKPSGEALAKVGAASANYWGLHDLHGLVWEWTEDFNSVLVTGESRNDGSIDSKLFCAAGAMGAADPKDYAAFMRYAFRASVQANFTLANQGFRCAQSMNGNDDETN